MARKVFFSFNFREDHWRASQVRQIGSLEGNAELSDNDWEAVKRKGDAAIAAWIDGQLSGKSCAIVLVGAATAGRRWIDYEIKKAWDTRKGLIGVRIHRLLNAKQQSTIPGTNPFLGFNIGGTPLSSVVTLYNPQGIDSRAAYRSIADSIFGLVESAIQTRGRYS